MTSSRRIRLLGATTGLQFDQADGMTPGVDDMIPGEIDVLINKLVAGPTGSAPGGTGTVMKAACGAVLGSSTTTVQ